MLKIVLLREEKKVKISPRRSNVQVWEDAASPWNKFQEPEQNPLRGERLFPFFASTLKTFQEFAETS